MQAYCMKCRAKREIKNPKSITLKNGRPATQGVCPVCGTKVYRIGKGFPPFLVSASQARRRGFESLHLLHRDLSFA